MTPSQHEPRRERLLAAAVRSIAMHGYEGVRLRDVAGQCGVTTGMLQYYFPTRDELLHAAFESAALDQVERWRHAIALEPDPARRLQLLLDQMSEEFFSANTCAVWTELCASAGRYSQLRPLVVHVFSEWRTILGAAVSEALQTKAIGICMLGTETAVDVMIAAFDGYELDLASGAAVATPESAAAGIRGLAAVLFPQRRCISHGESSSELRACTRC